MKTGQKHDTARRTCRAFFLALAFSLLPILLVGGIAVADRNTRATGFPDRTPAIRAERQENGALEVSFFDWGVTVSPAVMKAWNDGVLILKTATPHAAKAGAAAIEKSVDRFLELVFPKD